MHHFHVMHVYFILINNWIRMVHIHVKLHECEYLASVFSQQWHRLTHNIHRKHTHWNRKKMIQTRKKRPSEKLSLNFSPYNKIANEQTPKIKQVTHCLQFTRKNANNMHLSRCINVYWAYEACAESLCNVKNKCVIK